MSKEHKVKKEEPKTESAPQIPQTQNSTAQPAPTPEQVQMQTTVKEIEQALYAVKFFPVAVNEASKKEAMEKLRSIYSKGNETIRQLLLYMIHDILATSMDLKIMHNYEYFKMKNSGQDPSQLRIQVYRAMFNYNSSLEGLFELIRLLGSLKGSDDAAKLLTYHFSHLCTVENEASHQLRAAVLGALGDSESHYALRSLLEYAKYTDSERTFNRVVSALIEWEDKLEELKISDKEKDVIKKELKEIITSDFGGSHYG